MVASSSRHMHQQNIRGANRGRGNDDNFQDEPRSVLGGGHGHHKPLPPDSLKQSTFVTEALSDEESELAKFLFCADGEDSKAKSMGTVNAGWYALALEPLEVRNERIIMIFEAYAIFGALFLNVVWIIYEWGNANEDGGHYQHAAVDRTFECIMAIALGCNIFLSLYGAACWMLSIMIDSANQEFVFECRTMLTILQNLLMFTTQFSILGLFLATYKNLSPNLPEVIIAVSIVIIMAGMGMKYFGRHFATCMPLEFYHFPVWVQMMMGPSILKPSQKEKLRARAKLRADDLRKRAFHERRKMEPTFQESNDDEQSESTATGSIQALLRTAASNLGRNDDDISAYQKRLEEDWFNQVDQLKGRSVECLSHYMPLRLAEEVHKLVV